MKRIASLVLVLAATLTLVTCGSSSGSDGPKVAFVTNCVAEFWTIGKVGAEAAGKEFGVDVEVHMPPNGTAIEQKQILEDLVNGGVKAIAVSPKDPVNHTDLLNGIADKMPLITHDSDAPESRRLVYVGMDNYKAGRMCGELLKKALPNGGEIVIIVGTLDQDNAKRRRQGVIDEILGRSSDPTRFDNQDAKIEGNGFKVLATFVDGMDAVTAKSSAVDAINRYGELDALVGLFEYEPPVILDAVKAAGKLDSIKIVAFDENEATLEGIAAGEVVGTIVQDPYNYGWHSVRILSALLKDDRSVVPASGFYDIPAKSITKENVAAFQKDLAEKLGR